MAANATCANPRGPRGAQSPSRDRRHRKERRKDMNSSWNDAAYLCHRSVPRPFVKSSCGISRRDSREESLLKPLEIGTLSRF